MSVLQAITDRYSCRAYQDRPVEQEKLDRVLEAARLAPSARNTQQWRFVVVRDAATRQKLAAAAASQDFVGRAAVVLVAVASLPDYIMRCGQPAGPIDVAIALEHIALQAAAEGLGTCWIGAFDQGRVKELLGIPHELPVIEMMTLGYPADSPRPKDRVPLHAIVCYEAWHQPAAASDHPVRTAQYGAGR